MSPIVALTHHTATRIAEIGFLLILLAGVWLIVASIPSLRLDKTRTLVAGVALAVSGVLLIVSTHWGHFG